MLAFGKNGMVSMLGFGRPGFPVALDPDVDQPHMLGSIALYQTGVPTFKGTATAPFLDLHKDPCC